MNTRLKNRPFVFVLTLLTLALAAPFATHEVTGDEPDRQNLEPTKVPAVPARRDGGLRVTRGDRVRQLDGDLFGSWTKTDTTHALADVKLLIPTQPSQVLALAGNYRSHLQDDEVPPKFRIPQPFFKSPSCLTAHEHPIVIPKDAKTVHYEAELVVVIGKRCSKVSKTDALDYVFGVTAGNDVSERIWQNDEEVKDVQWWRAKGADTFGPVGPVHRHRR